jgi:hypothetical protein
MTIAAMLAPLEQAQLAVRFLFLRAPVSRGHLTVEGYFDRLYFEVAGETLEAGNEGGAAWAADADRCCGAGASAGRGLPVCDAPKRSSRRRRYRDVEDA